MANDNSFAVEKKEKRRKSKETRAKTPFGVILNVEF
jgi:hypothetical protein